MERADLFWQSFLALVFFFFQMLLLMETGVAGPAGLHVQEVNEQGDDSATTLPRKTVVHHAQGQMLRQFLARGNH